MKTKCDIIQNERYIIDMIHIEISKKKKKNGEYFL